MIGLRDWIKEMGILLVVDETESLDFGTDKLGTL